MALQSPSLIGFGRCHKSVSVIFSRNAIWALKEAFESAGHVSAAIALHDLNDIYLM